MNGNSTAHSPWLILMVALIAALLVAAGDDTHLARRERLENMSAEALNELRRKRERFQQLTMEERQQLQRFHKLLVDDENSDQLRLVLERYYEWLKTLSETDRAELLDDSVEERIAKIREIREQQQKDFFGLVGETRLPDEDISPLIQWVDSWVSSKQDEIREIFQSLPGRSRFVRMRGDPVRWASGMYSALGRVAPERAEQLIIEEDITALRGNLSEQAVNILDDQPEFDDKRRLVHRWIATAITARFRREVSDQELQKFFDEHLSADRRGKLDNMSPQKRQRELLRDYWRYQTSGDPSGQRQPDGDGRRGNQPTD